MHRIEKPLQDVENYLVHVASDEALTALERETLLPVLSSHMETMRRWKMVRLKLLT